MSAGDAHAVPTTQVAYFHTHPVSTGIDSLTTTALAPVMTTQVPVMTYAAPVFPTIVTTAEPVYRSEEASVPFSTLTVPVPSAAREPRSSRTSEVRRPPRVSVGTYKEVSEVREVIKEVPKIVYEDVERIVEVPEIQYKEVIVEVLEIQIKEVIKHVPVIEVKEIIKHVPKIEYRDVEKIVEVPQVRHVQQVMTYAAPQQIVQTLPPIITTAEAEYVTAPAQELSQFVTYAAPQQQFVTYAAPQQQVAYYAAPVHTAQHVVYAAPGSSVRVQGQDLFSLIDRNNDCVITREELKQAGFA